MAGPGKARPFTRVAHADDIREGRGCAVTLEGVQVAVFRRRARYFAVSDRCPHMGASLSEGIFKGGTVQCHWHGWCFDVATGECEQKPWARLPTYEVRVQGGDLLLRPPEPEEEEPEEDAGDEPWMTWDPDKPPRGGD
ncbi:MAG: Rieske (2Fe-2S) protein [Acidobacteriota bacterium]